MTEFQSTKSVAYSMEHEAVYAVTAYNSQNENLPKREKSRNNDSYFTKVARGNPLGLPTGTHCREYLAEWQCNIFQQDALQTRKPAEKQCEEMRDPHLMEFWPTLFEWPVFAVAHGVEAAALAGAAASQLGRAVVSKMAERAILLRLGPWGWAFFGVSIIASVIAHSLELSPIERWASYGPFSKDKDLRFTEEYEGLDAKKVYRALLSLLLAPQTKVQQHNIFPPSSARVEIRTPAAGQTGKIEHYAYWKDTDNRLHPLKPRGWHPLLADENDPASRIGIVAWYHPPNTRGSADVIVEARYWHKETQDWLPFDPTRPQQYLEGDSINMETGGWSRSHPVSIDGHRQQYCFSRKVP